MHRKNDKAYNSLNQLRIIAGQWRGRKLPIVTSNGLRPTPERVRETVFNWLTPYIYDARVLDCFSGSGALSLEALSRGAKSAIMLEKEMPVAKSLNSYLSMLSATNGQVININALSWLSQGATVPFDIIFLDPPFRKGFLQKTCALLSDNGYINDKGIVYIEVEKELSLTMLPRHWHLLKNKTAGQISYSLWQVNE